MSHDSSKKGDRNEVSKLTTKSSSKQSLLSPAPSSASPNTPVTLPKKEVKVIPYLFVVVVVVGTTTSTPSNETID
jgi:hypothetical protein